MRTRTWLWALSATAFPAALLACGDSSGGGGGSGGLATTSSTSSSSSKTVSTGVTGSTATTGSSSGAGGASSDNCPGTAYDLTPGTPLTITDTTAGANDDLKNFCAQAGDTTAAPDRVYAIHTPQHCSFTATLSSGFDGLLSLRSDCASRSGHYFCTNDHPLTENFNIDLPAGETHYLVVDGAADGASGPFTLTLNCFVPTCGDGVINPPEECDATSASCGNCLIISTAAADNCTAVALQTPTSVFLGAAPLFIPAPPAAPFSNSMAVDDQINPTFDAITCPFIPAAPAAESAPDQVFAFLATAAGNLKVEIGLHTDGTSNPCNLDPLPSSCWNSGMFIREAACATGTQVACDFANFNTPMTNQGVYTETVAAKANTVYYVFVKSPDALDVGPNKNVGSYNLKVSLTP